MTDYADLKAKAEATLAEHSVRPVVSRYGEGNGLTDCICRDCKLAAWGLALLSENERLREFLGSHCKDCLETALQEGRPA